MFDAKQRNQYFVISLDSKFISQDVSRELLTCPSASKGLLLNLSVAFFFGFTH